MVLRSRWSCSLPDSLSSESRVSLFPMAASRYKPRARNRGLRPTPNYQTRQAGTRSSFCSSQYQDLASLSAVSCPLAVYSRRWESELKNMFKESGRFRRWSASFSPRLAGGVRACYQLLATGAANILFMVKEEEEKRQRILLSLSLAFLRGEEDSDDDICAKGELQVGWTFKGPDAILGAGLETIVS